jgi:molybdenum cofactor cytidylyltransferase
MALPSDSSKLMLPLRDGKPIAWHSIRGAAALEPYELVVVVRPDQPTLTGIVDEAAQGERTKCIMNHRYREGMGTSLSAGIEALDPGTQAALVMLGDMPFVAPHIIEALISAYQKEKKNITIPTYGTTVGPPTLFARAAFDDLRRLTGEAGGRQLVAMYPEAVCLVPFSEDDRPPDVDTPQDLERLLSFELFHWKQHSPEIE